MKKEKLLKYSELFGLQKSLYFLVFLLCFNCIEPFDADISVSESLVVIEATLTNESDFQKVFVTRTFNFGEEPSISEPNAIVRIIGGGNTFSFQQDGDGTYISNTPFAAQPGILYQLLVTTEDGVVYSSNEITMTVPTVIDDLKAERRTNDLGEEGIAILLNTFDASGSALNYRYTYEETFKIIAPEWNPFDLVGDEAGSCELTTVLKETEQQVCYRTNFSNGIIQASTNDLSEDRVENFLVRFLNRDNYIISHRYSILVKQFVQSTEAFAFYETLNQFSSSESLFSELQLGFLEGNISSEVENEKVIGFFDVASVSEKRLFFNYADLFPNEPLPPYVEPCTEFSPPLADLGGCVLRPLVDNNRVRYTGENFIGATGEGPFFVVTRVCGDCTVLGEAVIPDFWIE